MNDTLHQRVYPKMNSRAMTDLQRFIFLSLLCCSAAFPAVSAAELAYRPARVDNPLKGIIPSSYGRTQLRFPHSLRYLDLPLARLMPAGNQFSWEPLEKKLEVISRDGKHAVVRIYLDWPGRTNTVPPFLHSETSIVRDGHWRLNESIPNYQSPVLRAALKSFVLTFGAKYDGHPDIAFIEAGLLGPWGEWLHAGKAGPMASEAVQQEILAAYQSAFKATKILLRFPTASTLDLPFGYHDDWFGFKRGGLVPHFEKLGLTNPTTWLREPIGGRVHPEIQECLASRGDPCELTEHHLHELASGHFTYLRLDHSQHTIQPGAAWENALRFAQKLGYEFHVTDAELITAENQPSLNVHLSIKNTGVAPFYYQWPFEIALSSDGIIRQRWQPGWDVRTILPNDPEREFHFQARNLFVTGKHQVLLRLRAPSSREHFVAFANESQDADLPGWLTLGEIVIP